MIAHILPCIVEAQILWTLVALGIGGIPVTLRFWGARPSHTDETHHHHGKQRKEEQTHPAYTHKPSP